jgi:hypothetical protein
MFMISVGSSIGPTDSSSNARKRILFGWGQNLNYNGSMARQARSKQSADTLLLTQKTTAVLFRDERDREVFLRGVKAAQERFNVSVIALCCSQPHEYALIIKHNGQPSSRLMQAINIPYALYRTDAQRLFASRFKSVEIHDETQLAQTIQRLASVSGNDVQCCLMGTGKPALEWMKPINRQILFEVPKPLVQLDTDNRQAYLQAWLKQNHCDESTLRTDKVKRNTCIRMLRQTTTLTLKDIAALFELTESSLSKILKQRE